MFVKKKFVFLTMVAIKTEKKNTFPVIIGIVAKRKNASSKT